VEVICTGVVLSFIYICFAVWYPFIKRTRLGSHYSAICLCLSRARIWISNVICRWLFVLLI